MSAIVLLDTSIYLNVLDVPGYNQNREAVLAQFAVMIGTPEGEMDTLLLPLGTVWETGNHIARLPDGARRRAYAEKFRDAVTAAFAGRRPYRPTHFPDRDEFARWLTEFPDYAMRNKSSTIRTEGTSLADLSIIKEWDRARSLNPMSRVRIWSLDADLAGYDQTP